MRPAPPEGPRRVVADWVWTPEGPLRGAEVLVGPEGRIAQVRRDASPDAARVPGLLLPGLVNAHAHLELADLRGKVPGGAGLSTWAQALLARRRAPDAEAIRAAVEEARALGTAALVDVTNTGAALPAMVEAGLRGVAQVELLGIEPERCAAALAHGRELLRAPGLPARTTCHAVVSCSRALLAEVLAPPARPTPPATLHADEDPADALLLREGGGPWAEFLDRLGRDWRGRMGQAPGTVALLEALGVLGPGLALVHAVYTDGEALDRVAAAGAAIVLCPRSNLHIGGTLPDVPGMLRRGIPLALGTDSLASSPDLDLLAEAVVLARAFPGIEAGHLVDAATTGGARLLEPWAPGAPPPDGRARGGLVAGAVHGLLHVAIPPTADPARTLLTPPEAAPWPRSWLSCPPPP